MGEGGCASFPNSGVGGQSSISLQGGRKRYEWLWMVLGEQQWIEGWSRGSSHSFIEGCRVNRNSFIQEWVQGEQQFIQALRSMGLEWHYAVLKGGGLSSIQDLSQGIEEASLALLCPDLPQPVRRCEGPATLNRRVPCSSLS